MWCEHMYRLIVREGGKLNWLIVGWLLLLSPAQFAARAQQPNSLPPRMKLRLENELAAAYFDGDSATVLSQAADLIKAVAPKRWDDVDAQLKGLGVPSLGRLLLSSRLELRAANPRASAPAVTALELQRILPTLDAELQRIAVDVKLAMKAQTGQLNVTEFDDFETRVWRLHVLRNELTNVSALIDYGIETMKSRDGRAVQSARRIRNGSKLEDHPSQPPEQVLAELSAKATKTAKNIEEATVEVRADRLTFAVKSLRGNASVVQRIKAAWAGDFDGYALSLYFANNPDPNARVSPRLRDPDFPGQCAANVEELRAELGADLLTKSRHFYTGLHWWMRGRYGMGANGFGLLKSPLALKNPNRMFGLHMPVSTPVPTEPGVTPSIPEVDRRHHYGWMFEYRKLFRTRATSKSSNSRSKNSPTSKTKLSRFY